jgi:hypothetical protein
MPASVSVQQESPFDLDVKCKEAWKIGNTQKNIPHSQLLARKLKKKGK